MSGEPEHLVACAIRRDGKIHRTHEKGAHWEIRAALNDDDPTKPMPGDQEGFLTSGGRFVGRRAANEIADACGQCRRMGREMLSSDVEWDGWKAHMRANRPQQTAPRRKLFRA